MTESILKTKVISRIQLTRLDEQIQWLESTALMNAHANINEME
jgi:hypothetical protein